MIAYNDTLDKFVMSHVKRIAKAVHKTASFHPHQLISMKGQDWIIRVSYKENESDVHPIIKNIRYPRNSYNKYRVISIFSIALNSSVVTDYILPFAMAILTLIYCFSGSESSLNEAVRNAFA